MIQYGTWRHGIRLLCIYLISWTLLFVSAGATRAQASGRASTVGIVARIGWGPTGRLDPAYGLGFELEAFPATRLVPSIRIDHWAFGISCTGFAPCPSGVTTYSLGAKYRFVGSTRLAPYAGGDLGYMDWLSGARGLSVRGRAGADIRIVRHADLILDGSFTRYVKLWAADRRMLQKHLWGFTAGLRLWL